MQLRKGLIRHFQRYLAVPTNWRPEIPRLPNLAHSILWIQSGYTSNSSPVSHIRLHRPFAIPNKRVLVLDILPQEYNTPQADQDHHGSRVLIDHAIGRRCSSQEKADSDRSNGYCFIKRCQVSKFTASAGNSQVGFRNPSSKVVWCRNLESCALFPTWDIGAILVK